MSPVDVAWEVDDSDGVLRRELQATTEQLLSAAGLPGAEVSLRIVDDRKMIELNSRHLDENSSTDVLSFPQYELGGDEALLGELVRRHADGPPLVLGDIVICLDQAARQSDAYGAHLRNEIVSLVIHGFLHLLGHDHGNERDRAKMNLAADTFRAAMESAHPIKEDE